MRQIIDKSRESLDEWMARRCDETFLDLMLIDGAAPEVRARYRAASEKHHETLHRMRGMAKPVGGHLEYEKWMLEALRVSDEEWAKESAECLRLARENSQQGAI